MATNAKYKVYDSTANSGSGGWIEYHFTTNAGQVSTTYNSETGSGRKFVTPAITINSNTAGTAGAKVTVGSGDTANIEIDGAHIKGQAVIDTTDSNSALHYIANTDSVAVALGKLDRAANLAYNHADLSSVVPYTGATSDVSLGNHSLSLSTLSLYCYSGGNTISCGGFGVDSAGNMYVESSTNGGVYFEAADGVYIGTSKGTANANQVATKGDFANYVPTTRTVNGKPLSSNIDITSGDISYAGPDSSWQFTVKQGIDLAISTANGNAKSVVIYATESSLGNAYANADFNSTNNTLNITATSTNKYKLKSYSGADIDLSSLKIGDTVFIAETDVPDRWLADVGTSGSDKIYSFEKLETYNMTWGAISNKPTLSISGQTITIGNNALTVPELAPATNGGNYPNNGTATTSARSDHTHSGYIPTSGTTALSGNIVPSTANSVYLGASNKEFNTIYTRNIKASYDILIETDDEYVSVEADEGFRIRTGESYWASLLTDNLTQSRSYQFPNKGGTLALTSDLSDFRKITVASSSSTPSSPSTGDIWIEI